MSDLERYSVINQGMRREFILLQGTGCRWKRCAFCDYHLDTSSDPYAVNRPVLESVTGEYGVLDVINSGSAPELDGRTIEHIKAIVKERGIHDLWFEAHWMYRNVLPRLASRSLKASLAAKGMSSTATQPSPPSQEKIRVRVTRESMKALSWLISMPMPL